MDTSKSSNSNRPYKVYHQGDFYEGLSQQDKEAYTAGTISCKGKRRIIPEHVLKQMAQPEHRDEVLATLGLTNGTTGEAIKPTSPGMPRYYSRLKLVATATCYACGITYKLSSIRYHKAKSLEPEQPICTWCYRDLKDNGTPPPPQATPGNRASQGYTGTKAKSLEAKLEVARTVLSNYTVGTYKKEVDRYIAELGAGPQLLVELYFNKEHKLMDHQILVKDFIDQLESKETEPLEEVEFIIP